MSYEDSNGFVSEIAALLRQHKGKCASINPRDSQSYGGIVFDVEVLKPPSKGISVIEEVTNNLLVLNYFDAREMHYFPIVKIIKVNIIMREK